MTGGATETGVFEISERELQGAKFVITYTEAGKKSGSDGLINAKVSFESIFFALRPFADIIFGLNLCFANFKVKVVHKTRLFEVGNFELGQINELLHMG